RFLQELYPLAALLEREGVRGEFLPGPQDRAAQDQAVQHRGAQYGAALWRGEQEVWRGRCLIPLHPRTSPDGREVRGPTGWLRVRANGALLHDARIPTDGELFWDWYQAEVLPEVLDLADSRPGLPVFRNLSVSVHVSEPDLGLDVLDERISMTEALTEEVYFGTLDALKRHTGTPSGNRSLMPGRIAPVAVSTAGQGGWARVVLTPWDGVRFPPEFTADDAPHAPVVSEMAPRPLPVDRPWKPAHLWAYAREQAGRYGLDWEVPAFSVEGRPVPAVLRTGPSPVGGVIVTGGQHANETTGPVAAVHLIETLAASPLPFAVLPLENPDGAHLHRALIQLNPEHMHHAARYTALGDDLESRLREGEPRWESRARTWAAQEVGATLHLNLHGYPAHEWVRPYSGYAPFGFESWALPAGFMTIVWYHPDRAQDARALAEAIALRLLRERDVAEHAARACRASAAHVHQPHFQLIHGLPFLLAEHPNALCPLTVITEAPDETIYGEHFSMFVRAHLAVCEAAVQHHLQGGGTRPSPPAARP
ncbi:MAG: M14 family zinc carboxypeptidase, partial [Deinococcus sp.]